MKDPLSPTLQSWRHEPAPAPDFNEGVWARIRSAETARPPASVFHFPIALPLAASVAVLLALAAGTGGAFALSHARATDRMAAAYVRTIDPVQMTALHLHP